MKYPLAIRILHWIRAGLIFGLIASGWYMSGLYETNPQTADFLYPNHKQFGVLIWLLALVHLALRRSYKSSLPVAAEGLKRWEKALSHVVHKIIIALTLIIPLLGYAMSSSYTQSAGVPFFFISHIPEILPKNDNAFYIFQTLHGNAAYLLLACILLHVAGALKHLITDKNGPSDVMPRML